MGTIATVTTDVDSDEIWVDFNDVDEAGLVETLGRFAAPSADLRVGAPIVAGDHEGNRCDAVVWEVESGRDVVVLKLDLGSFRAASAAMAGSVRDTAR